ncbi:MAG: NAD(P)/FAD-dependent oxidoreductase, partial [Sinobacteraceae bacterium]|nr:NAD(P)/FAD-dependent oxidoreductase [Nevskiaceae bacterium]
AMHRLRDELKLAVRGFDMAGGPGGTWWWNRYPGARCDIESIYYSYSFSDEIQREWTWSERYAAQPEILRYLEWAAKKLDVPRSFSFNTKITSMVWDDDRNRWLVGTDTGEKVAARFIVSATGNVSVEKPRAEFPGIENFQGEIYFTGTWPHEPLDFSDKRVGLIGTGASGIQVTQELAKTARHLTVFQRTANYGVPSRNEAVPAERQRWNAEHWRELRGNSRGLNFGINAPKAPPSALATAPEERQTHYDQNWQHGGLQIIASSYGDVLLDEQANDTLAEYIRERIRERVNDPEVAEKLCPKTHPYGTKRPPLEDGYYEAFNQDNVELVDVSEDEGKPITEVTATGIRTGDTEYEVDVIILATGFDAFTGALMSMGITGRGGRTLAEDWSDGPHTYLGITSAGFPNLFTITGPTCAVIFYNNPLAIEDHVDFAVNAIRRTLGAGAEVFEVDRANEDTWMKLAHDILHLTLMPTAKSWYMGANIPGKPIATWMWPLGAPLYRAMVADVVNNDYAGIRIGDKPAGRVPPLLRVDPNVALVLSAMLEDAKPPEQMTLEDTRAMIEQLTMVQKPAPESVEVIETSFLGPADERPVRIYRPKNAQGPLPVVVFYY